MEKKKNVEDLTGEDVEAIFKDVIDPSWIKFDYLCAVVSVFSQVEKSNEEEDKKKKKNKNKNKNQRDASQAGTELEREVSSKKDRSVTVVREEEESSSMKSKRERLKREKSLKKPQASNPSCLMSKQERLMMMREEELYSKPGVHTGINISKGERLIAEKSFEKQDTNPVLPMSKEEKLKRERLLKRPVEENPKKNSKRVSPKDMGCSGLKNTTGGDEKKRARGKGNMGDPSPPSDLPVEFKNRIKDIGGTDLKLVIQKELSWTDTSDGHNRLLMPLNQVMSDDFLTDEEKNVLKTRRGRNCGGIKAKFIDSSPAEYEMVMKKWIMKKKLSKDSTSYVFNKAWCLVLKKNGIEAGMTVQIWSFRVKGRLYFALVKVEEEEEEEENNSSNQSDASIISSGGAVASPSSQSKPKQN